MREISRREFIKYASAGIAAASTVTLGARRLLAADGQPRKPNILFVFADQMRFCAMGCMGNKVVKTPNLDKLAAQGLLLENAFSSSPVCTPYRAQMLTGRYGFATGVLFNDLKLPNEEVTIAELMKAQGYATGYIGKWHLSSGRKSRDPLRLQGYVPPEDHQGFDYWAALECSHTYFKTRYYGDKPEVVEIDGYEPDVQTDLAIEYMKQNREKPFCLMVSFGPPHDPYLPPEEYNIYKPANVDLRPNVPEEIADRWRKAIAQYYGLITSLDADVGRMMKALDDLGIADDTIFCFTSDHGDMLGSQHAVLKQRPWEESIHVPFIVRYPRQLKPGQRKDVLLSSVDITPTLLAMCAVPVPKNIQGLDLSGVWLGTSDKEPEAVFFSNTPGALGVAGAGGSYDWRGIRTKEWMYAYHGGGDWVFYNIKNDPYELKNLVGDDKFKSTRDALRAKLDAWRKQVKDEVELKAPPPAAKPN